MHIYTYLKPDVMFKHHRSTRAGAITHVPAWTMKPGKGLWFDCHNLYNRSTFLRDNA